MAKFTSLLRLTLKHEYFSDGVCRGLKFQPAGSTEKMLASYGLLVKEIAAGMELLLDCDWGVAWEEDLILRLAVFAEDPYFKFFTENNYGASRNLDTPIYYLANYTCSDIEKSTITQQQAPESVANAPRGRPGSIAKPALIIDIVVSAEGQDGLNSIAERPGYSPVELSVSLLARSVRWKYYFFGGLAGLDMEIQDLDTSFPVTFGACFEPVPNNGKAFLSQQAIAMSDAPKQRFQLRERVPDGRALIKRLPNASFNSLGLSRLPDGEQVLVAEIYVN